MRASTAACCYRAARAGGPLAGARRPRAPRRAIWWPVADCPFAGSPSVKGDANPAGSARRRFCGGTNTRATIRRATVAASSDGGDDAAAALASLAASLAVGALLSGAGVGLDDSLPGSARGISCFLGWSYFSAWSISFLPQIVENHRTTSVGGLAPDYILFSALGYASYCAYTGALFFSGDVRASYAALHSGSVPDVSAADVAFASLALCSTLVVAAQYAAMRRPGDRGLSPFAVGVAGAVALAYAGCALHIGTSCADVSDCSSWLPMLVLLGGVKVVMTLIKYTPQVLLNHRRRSTEGWSDSAVLLDVAGGLLSFSQVVLNAAARHDLSVITGNPAKLWVAALSIGYDAIFLAQRYMLYGRGPPGPSSSAAAPDPGAAGWRAPTETTLPPARAVLAFATVGGSRRRAGRASGSKPQP